MVENSSSKKEMMFLSQAKEEKEEKWNLSGKEQQRLIKISFCHEKKKESSTSTSFLLHHLQHFSFTLLQHTLHSIHPFLSLFIVHF